MYYIDFFVEFFESIYIVYILPKNKTKKLHFLIRRTKYGTRDESMIFHHDCAQPQVAIPVKNYLENSGWEVYGFFCCIFRNFIRKIIASCLVAYSGRFLAIALFKRINCVR